MLRHGCCQAHLLDERRHVCVHARRANLQPRLLQPAPHLPRAAGRPRVTPWAHRALLAFMQPCGRTQAAHLSDWLQPHILIPKRDSGTATRRTRTALASHSRPGRQPGRNAAGRRAPGVRSAPSRPQRRRPAAARTWSPSAARRGRAWPRTRAPSGKRATRDINQGRPTCTCVAGGELQAGASHNAGHAAAGQQCSMLAVAPWARDCAGTGPVHLTDMQRMPHRPRRRRTFSHCGGLARA